MTVLVGIKCTDGIVIGSDSSATFGTGQISTIEQTTKKIEILHDRMIVAGTGQIGLGQRFCNAVNLGYQSKAFAGQNAVQMATKMSQMAVQDFQSTGANRGSYGALVAYPAGNKIELCEFATTDFQPELKTNSIWYASMGSGQLIADPFLGLMRSTFWQNGMPSLQDGIFITTWAISHAIEINAGGVNGPIQMATLTLNNGNPVARFLTEDELTEHKQYVSGAVEHLRSYKGSLAGNVANAPDVPAPPAAAN
jgi:20S proteasome alpha/beta subunit